MENLKIVTNNDLKNWVKEIFEKNSFKMIDVSEKKETFRRALASGKIYVGKERDNHVVRQEEINNLLVKYAKEGKKVLRLKGGDPFIFGRGGEEIEP